jgi:Zn-dependent oligopeptidase
MKNDFTWVRWKPKDIKSKKDSLVSHKKDLYKKLKSLNDKELNFENVILTLSNSSCLHEDNLSKIHLLGQVHTDKTIRDTAQEVELAIENELVDLERDPDVFNVLKKYMENIFKKEKKKLDESDIKLAQDLYESYKKMGFDLTKPNQEKLKKIIKKLNEMNQKFSLNINNYEDFIFCSKEELSGLNTEYINGLKKQGDMYKVSLDYPDLLPFLSGASSRAKRYELSVKNSRKGGQENLNILKELIDLRIQESKLLGYKNYTDYKLSNKMAKDSKTVNNFVDSLTGKIIKPAKKDLELIKSFAKEIGISKLEPHDTAFVIEKLIQRQFSINQESLREYFETERVLNAMFNTFEELFSLKFTRKDTKLWHKDAFHIEVCDKNSNKLLAHLLMDLYPRPNKYSHASASSSGVSDVKMITLICNFRSPSGSGKNKLPSMMSLDEVETLFHEFGHALHFMLYNKKHSSQNSFRVAWDFVELPSQMLENFIWNEKSLVKLSSHFKTGKSLDKNQIKNILDSRNFLKPFYIMRQLAQTRLDLDIHTGKIKSYNRHHQKLIKQFVGVAPHKESLFPAGFGHMSGYDSLYYSYLWALVYAEDVFSVFKDSGIINKTIGARYRKEILEFGASRSETKSVEAFLLRKPNNKAFLKSFGI